MSASNIPFFEFHHITKDLRALNEVNQIHTLKRELFLALERAIDNQDAAHRAHEQLYLFRTEALKVDRSHQEILAATQRELAEARDSCRHLLAVIERAAAIPDVVPASAPEEVPATEPEPFARAAS